MLEIVSQETADFDALSTIQIGWQFDVAQLGPSSSPSAVSLIQSQNAAFNRFRLNTSYDQRLHVRPGYYSFGILEPDSPTTWFGREIIPQGALLVFPHEDEVAAVSYAGFHGNGMHFKASYLERLAHTVYKMRLDSLASGPGIYLLDTRQVKLLRTELKKWQQMAAGCPRVTAVLVERREEALAMAVLDGLRAPMERNDTPLLKSDRALKLALEYIHSESLEHITASGLSTFADCSQRWLEQAFRKRFGITPKQYIKCLRLARVREGLLKFQGGEDRTIIDLASEYGFWHMGQFAADYRRVYGELPSETRLRISVN